MNALAMTERSSSPLNLTPQVVPSHAAGPMRSSLAAGPDILDYVLEGIERLSSGLALVDSESQLLYANASARSSIAQAGWTVEEGWLRCRTSHDQVSWSKALHEVCARKQRHLYDMAAQSGKSFAALVCVSLDSAPRVLVTFGRAELCGTLELQMYASRHCLTLAESQVLRKLSQGMRPAQIAVENGVALTTVATQVAAVRAKTGSASVRQLLTTLSRLPPVQPALTSLSMSIS